MPTITIYFDREHPEIEFQVQGKRKPIGKSGSASRTDKISVDVPTGTFVKYIEYWTKFTKWKTQWIQRLVTDDLSYGAKPPKAVEPAPAPEIVPPDIEVELPPVLFGPPPFAPPVPPPPVTPPPPPPRVPLPEKSLREQWDDFFKNPDVITAIGLTPSSIQESFSLVFSKYSIINDQEQEPAPGDYVSVGLIIAGIVTAAAAVLWEVIPGAGALADLSYIEPGLTAAKVAGFGIPRFLSTLKAAALANPLLALLLITQVDLIFWGPSVIRDPIQQLSKNATGYKITLETAIRNNDWTVAAVALSNLERVYEEMDTQLSSAPTKFFEMVGVNYADFRAILETGRASLESFKKQYPRLAAIPTTFSTEFLIDDVKVEDGDTINWPNHPEAGNKIRILGIDAHESGTAAGIEETAYLKSLLEGRQVKVLTHQFHDPEKTTDIYGRLLGGVFIGDQDVALAMLNHFGKSILTPTKYQDKYRWIDWDLYKKTAEAAKGPAVKEFKIYIDSDPSGAKLFIDGKYTRHLTPSDEVELKDVMDMLTPGSHVIMASKAGLEGSVVTDIVDGVNPDIFLTLKVKGIGPTEPETAPGPEPEPAEKFTITIMSTPSRAKLYIDGVYTHHLTESNEKELEDVMHLLTPGKHIISATKGGKVAEKFVEIKAGYNEPVFLTLKAVGLQRSKEEIEADLKALRDAIKLLEGELEKL